MIFEFLLHAALVFQQFENAAQEFLAGDHGGVDDGFLDLLDLARVGELGRIVHFDHLAIRGGDAVANARRGGDQVDIEFALQPLLDDFQVQQAEKAAAETEAQGHGILRLEAERAVVEPQLFQGVAQQAVLVGFHGIEAREDHRLDFLETGQRLGGGELVVDDGVADLGVGDGLDVGKEEAHLSGRKFVARDGFGRLVAQFLHLKHLPVGPQADLLPAPQPAVEHAHQDDHAAVRVEPGIENQRAQRRVVGASGRRHQEYDVLQNLVDADALFGAGEDRVVDVLCEPCWDSPGAPGIDLHLGVFSTSGNRGVCVRYAGQPAVPPLGHSRFSRIANSQTASENLSSTRARAWDIAPSACG